MNPFGLRLGIGIGCFHQVIDNDEVGAKASDCTTDRDGLAAASSRGGELQGAVNVHPGMRKQLPIEVAGHDSPGVAGMFLGKITAVAGNQDFSRGIVTQKPGRERHAREQRLPMPGWDFEDQPRCMFCRCFLQDMAHRLNMPVHEEGPAIRRIDEFKHLQGERQKLLAAQGLNEALIGERHGHDGHPWY